MPVSSRSLRRRREAMRSRRPLLERLEDRSLLTTAALQPAGMTAWYRAENNANDFIGGHTGTLVNGATANQQGEVGNAFTFDSNAQQRVSAGDSPDWILGSTASNFSIDAWVKLNNTGASQALVSQSEGNGDVNRWLFWVNSSGTLQFEINVAGSGAPVDIISAQQVPVGDGNFHHVAVVRTGTDYTFYLDGVAGTAVKDNANTAIPDVGALLNIGSSSGDSNFVNGQIDEVEIFNNTAISADQINAIFLAQHVGKVTFTVTNTNDTGTGSLRNAITGANASVATTGREVIGFDIAGVTTISLASPLPALTGTTIIDGFTQGQSTFGLQSDDATPNTLSAGTGTGQGAGLNAHLLIEVNGSGQTGGLTLNGPNSAVRGLVIRNFNAPGITVGGTGTVIEGNFIGTDNSGTTFAPNGVGIQVNATNVTIGGTTPAVRNLISANNSTGIFVSSPGATIQGNLIGTDVNGTGGMANGGDGVSLQSNGALVGGSFPGAQNVISKSGGSGVSISGNVNFVQGNLIGTNVSGTGNLLGNGVQGVLLTGTSANNTIGGTQPGEGNVIAFSVFKGVVLELGVGTGNAILGNSIFGNLVYGIDLNDDGPKPNDLKDPDTGANNIQNFPIISTATPPTAFLNQTKVTVSLNSIPNTTFRLEFFASPTSDPAPPQGKTFIDFRNVTTDGNGDFGPTAFTLTNQVAGSNYTGQVITATATSTNLTPTAEPANDTSEFSAGVTAVVGQDEADVTITKDDGQTSVPSGSDVKYTLTVDYPLVNGNVSPVSVQVNDPVPAGLTNFQYTSSVTGGATGNTSNSGAINDAVSMPLGSAIIYVITAHVSAAAGAQIVNQATATVQTVADPNSSNGVNTATDTDAVTAASADLSVTKSDGVSGVSPDTDTTYTITVANTNGPSEIDAVTVSDLIPASLQNAQWGVVSATGGATSTAAGVSHSGNINDSVNLPKGGVVTYTLTAHVNPLATPGSHITNTVSLALPAGANDPTLGNNVATDDDVINGPPVDLQITKTDGLTSAVPGTNITYTVVVKNNTAFGVTGAQVIDQFSTNPKLTVNGWGVQSKSANVTVAPSTGTGNLSSTVDFPANEVNDSVTYTVSVKINPSVTGSLDNTASVTLPAGFNDPIPANNFATESVTGLTNLTPQATLHVNKVSDAAQYLAGQDVIYTITVTNQGPSDAPITVQDTFDAAFTNVSFTTSQQGGVIGNDPGSGNLNDAVLLPPGAQVFYRVVATLSDTASGSVNNTASITLAPGLNDPSEGTDNDNSKTIGIQIVAASADLEVVKKEVSAPQVFPGGDIGYVIDVRNNGPSDATNVHVVDTFLASITNVTWIRTLGGLQVASGSGNINESGLFLAKGDTFEYIVSGKVSTSAPAGSLDNTVTVDAPGGVPDNTLGNNSKTASTTVVLPTADLAITKSDGVGVTTIMAGSDLTYKIVVTNTGSTVSGAKVIDNLPASLTNVAWSASPANLSTPASGTGSINATLGSLANGDSVTITVNAHLNISAAGSLDNTASVTAPAGFNDPPNNNQAADHDQILAPSADLSITKDDFKTEVTPGDALRYKIVVTNNGTITVPNALVVDNFPAAFTNASFTTSLTGGATINTTSTTNINNLVTLPPGATITYTVDGSIDLLAGGQLINTATVTSPANIPDPNPGNNSQTDTDTIKALTRGFLAVGADASKNGKPKVNVYSAAGILSESFLAYGSTYHGGVRVAMGDVNGDGIDDVITAPGRSQSPVIKVWDGASLIDATLGNATELTAFRIQAYATSFTGGVFVAVGDVLGDGRPDIVVTPGMEGTSVKGNKNGGVEVRVFQNNSATTPGDAFSDTPSRKFLAFPKNSSIGNIAFLGGGTVAVGDVIPGGKQEVIVGSGSGIRALVRVFDIQGVTAVQTLQIKPFADSFKGGVFVSSAFVNADLAADILIAAGQGGGSKLEIRNGAGGGLLRSTTMFTGTATAVNTGAAVRIASKDITGDGVADQIYAAQGPDGRSHKLRRAPLVGAAVDFLLVNDADFTGGYFLG